MKFHGSHRLSDRTLLECEVLIIGSGAGGSAIADTLTDAGIDVLMLEEGPCISADYVPASLGQSMRTMWREGGFTVAYGRPSIGYAEGRCVGGSTEINSAIFQIPPGALLDSWAEHFGDGSLKFDALLPHLEHAAKSVNASPTQNPGPATEILQSGANIKAWQGSNLDRGQERCVGTNMCSQGCPTGGKQSMSNSLLPRALGKGLRLVADCRVTRIKSRDGRAVGAVGISRDISGRSRHISVQAGHVFVCAGAIHTPFLLMKSGISYNIGRSLCLHPTVRVFADFKDPIDADLQRLPLFAVTEFMPDFRLGGSVYSPATYSMTIAEDWIRRREFLNRWRHTGIYYAMVRGTGRGRVYQIPGTASPIVTFAASTADYANLKRGLAKLVSLLFAAGATRVQPSIAGHRGWRRSEWPAKRDLEPIPIRKANLMTIHLAGGAPIGSEECGATNTHGRVKGYDNLYVADASLLPESPGVNPQALIMAMAYRNGERFLDKQ